MLFLFIILSLSTTSLGLVKRAETWTTTTTFFTITINAQKTTTRTTTRTTTITSTDWGTPSLSVDNVLIPSTTILPISPSTQPTPTTLQTQIIQPIQPTTTPQIIPTPTPEAQAAVPTPVVETPQPPSSGTGATFTGEGTFYDAIGFGACGTTLSNDLPIVAISTSRYDEVGTPNPNNNPLCGRRVIAFTDRGSVEAVIQDRCGGCARDDLDFSRSAFDAIGLQADGRIPIQWRFAD